MLAWTLAIMFYLLGALLMYGIQTEWIYEPSIWERLLAIGITIVWPVVLLVGIVIVIKEYYEEKKYLKEVENRKNKECCKENNKSIKTSH